MTAVPPVLIDMPMPIRTPRLLLRPKQPGDGAITAAAVAETWQDLHQWMRRPRIQGDFTPERMEIRTRQMMAATQQPVVWCGFHDIDWTARICDTGYWVRKSAQQRCGEGPAAVARQNSSSGSARRGWSPECRL